MVDASVAVKWFIKENHSDHAITLLTLEQKLVGPTLALYEVAGAFVRAQRRDDIDADEAEACRNRWLHTVKINVLRLECDTRDIARGAEIAASLQHPLADCVYLAMAERLDANLVTADEVFFEKAGTASERVFFIAEALDLSPAATITN